MARASSTVLAILSVTLIQGRIINGVDVGSNICSGWKSCNSAAGYQGWCDNQWNHHCCFKEPPPSTETCVQLDPCHYNCCVYPAKPCRYDCCNPTTGEVLGDSIVTLNLTTVARVQTASGPVAQSCLAFCKFEFEFCLWECMDRTSCQDGCYDRHDACQYEC